jgi:hypothetical protein
MILAMKIGTLRGTIRKNLLPSSRKNKNLWKKYVIDTNGAACVTLIAAVLMGE